MCGTGAAVPYVTSDFSKHTGPIIVFCDGFSDTQVAGGQGVVSMEDVKSFLCRHALFPLVGWIGFLVIELVQYVFK